MKQPVYLNLFKIRPNYKVFLFLIKIAIAAICVFYITNQYFGLRFQILPLSLGFFDWSFAIGANLVLILLAVLKWHYLLKGVSVKSSFLESVAVNWFSLFVGTFAFGIIGADVVRIGYLTQSKNQSAKTALGVVLLDRLSSLGALGLITALGGISKNFDWSLIWPLSWTILFVVILLVAPVLIILVFKYPNRYGTIFYLAMVQQAVKVFSFIFMIWALNASTLPMSEKMFACSFGFLVELMPISFDGFGTTHAVLSYFTSSIDIVRIYNLFFLTKIGVKLIGALFAFKYLSELDFRQLLASPVFFGPRKLKQE